MHIPGERVGVVLLPSYQRTHSELGQVTSVLPDEDVQLPADYEERHGTTATARYLLHMPVEALEKREKQLNAYFVRDYDDISKAEPILKREYPSAPSKG